MNNIRLDYTYITDFIKEKDIFKMQSKVNDVHKVIDDRSGIGSDYLGWLDLPSRMTLNEIEDIKKTAEEIRKNSDILIVIGIGGSYLGAKAVIDALSHSFHNNLSVKTPQIYFAGQNMSGKYLRANAVQNLFKNQGKDQFATRVEIRGRIGDTQTSTLQAIGAILHNAFVEAYAPQFEKLPIRRDDKVS